MNATGILTKTEKEFLCSDALVGFRTYSKPIIDNGPLSGPLIKNNACYGLFDVLDLLAHLFNQHLQFNRRVSDFGID